MSRPDPIYYDRGTLSAPELQKAVDEVLKELSEGGNLEALAASAGTTAEEVRAMRVQVAEAEAGVAPALIFIVVHLAGGGVSAAGAAGARAFWKKVILPRVRKAKRSDAIGDERADQAPD